MTLHRLIPILLLTAAPVLADSPSTVETKHLTSAVLADNKVGLDTRRSMKVYLPPGYASGRGRYPVVYLLHNINWSNERMFGPGTDTQATFDRAIARGIIKPFIVVAPDYTSPAVGPFYANSSTAGRWEDYTLREVIPFIDAHYRTLARAESRAITGDVLGAYGAMLYAIRNPDVFGVVYGMHVVGTGTGLGLMSSKPDWNQIFAAESYSDLAGNPYSPVYVAMAQTFLPNPARPPFYCDFIMEPAEGSQLRFDPRKAQELRSRFLLDQVILENLDNARRLRGIKFDWGRYDPNQDHVYANQAFTRKLDELGIEHEAEEFRGLPWDKYWNEAGRVYTDVMPFFARHLDFN